MSKGLPSVGLARKPPKEYSREWMQQRIVEHGSTLPLKLERRRQKLSGCSALLERAVKMVQEAKKEIISESEGQRVKIKSSIKDSTERESELANLACNCKERVMGYEMALGGFVAQQGILEALTLIVDSLTLRAAVPGANGQIKGYTRFSVANYAQEQVGASLWELRLVEALAEKHLGPEKMTELRTAEESEGSDTLEVDDEEVYSEEPPVAGKDSHDTQ